MGYRSNLIIAVKKEILAQDLIDPLIPAVLKNQEHNDHNGVRYWVIEQWKWYGSYPEIQQIEAFFEKLPVEQFGAVRIGEELNDVQTWGDPWEMGIEVLQSISCPVATV